MVSPEELAGPDRARQLFGAEVVDTDGAKVGSVTEVFLDDDTDQPTWVSVRTGWFGVNESLVPLDGAEITGDRIRVRHDKATIKDAPRSDDGQPLSRDDEGALYQHYAHGSPGRHPERGDAEVDATDDRAVVRADGGARQDDGTLIRSEEQLAVDTERVATGRARMRKFLVTQEQQITVSVSREDVRVEYVTDVDPGGDAAADGFSAGDLTDRGQRPPADRDRRADGPAAGDGWIVLYEQRPVVTMEWVPVERVRLGTVTVTAEETVTGDVRQERLDVVTDDLPDGRSDDNEESRLPR